MPLVEIQVLPLGTGSPSVSEYVAKAVDVIRRYSKEYKVTPMATVLKVDDISVVGNLLKDIETAMKNNGVPRVVMVIRIDDRFDKELDMDRKVKRVMERLGNE